MDDLIALGLMSLGFFIMAIVTGRVFGEKK